MARARRLAVSISWQRAAGWGRRRRGGAARYLLAAWRRAAGPGRAAAKRRAEREADILEGPLCHAVETWIAASGGGSGRQYDALRVLLNSIPGVCYCHACCSARGEA